MRGGIKLLTMNAIDTEQVAEEILADTTSELFDKFVGERLTKQREEKNTIQAFRDALEELPKLLRRDTATGDKPLVFIIDELDRCRPLFALELLEKIKHFFSVPNVHFVMGVNLSQLRNSVELAYGSSIDAHAYLQKFIHLTLTFDSYEKYESERASLNFLNHLVRSMDFPKTDTRGVEMTTKCIERMVRLKKLSLRSIERIMSYLAIAYAFSDERALRIPPILAGLCVLKVIDPIAYGEAKRGELIFNRAAQALGLPDSGTEGGSDWENNWWRFCTDDNVSDQIIERYNKNLFEYSITRQEIVPMTANYILDSLLR